MRILVDGMPRTIGGIGSLIVNLAECSRKKSNENDLVFEFIIAGTSGYLPLLEEKGYKYYIAPPIKKIKQYKEFLEDLFANHKFDYLWFNNTSKVNLLLPEAAKRNGLKVISHPHGIDTEEKGIKRIAFKVLDAVNTPRMFSLIDVPFACSEEAANIYYKGNPDLRKRTTIIKNGISTSTYTFNQEDRDKIRLELHLDPGDCLLGAVGRLTAVKNYAFIINLLASLEDKYKMIIIGDGEEKEKLSELVHEKKLENRCFLLGAKDNVADYYSAMDCFLMPSFNEGMPYSVIEAQCEGLPCVLSDTLSKELDITGLVQYCSIESVDSWKNDVNKISPPVDRALFYRKVKEAGYSIENTYLQFERSIRDNENDCINQKK